MQSGYCPRGFCFGNESKTSSYMLSSCVSLNEIVCSDSRKGRLCGGCRENHSHFFHSENYNCFVDKYCNMGLLFYVLSEIVPVTIIFTMVIFFNVKVTSGAMNGLILFVQLIDTMLIDANGVIPVHPIINVFMSSYQFLYGMFNLDLFTVDSLSFCLWKGANTLDILAIKYVTIIYSISLLFVAVFFMKLCDIAQLKKKLPFKFVSSDDIKGTVIHGFSTFFVMCYSQCAKVTLFLLTPSLIYSVGPPNKHNTTKVVFYAGNFLYFKDDHVKYAIPGLFFAVTVILIPPLLLIIYPLCYRLFALLGLEESRFLYFLCKTVSLEKIKPQFDSFQSCFKDNYRFFAGLYFLYRLVALITFLALDSLINFYIALEMQLIVMFTLQATIRVYKKHWHNTLDTFLFANLAIINAITMYNYTSLNDEISINFFSAIQTFLVLLPMLYAICYACSQIYWKVKATYRRKGRQNDFMDTLTLVDYRQFST